ncbi:MAG: alpha/beta hydrolase [Methylocystis sp.]|nr:alpha/beta hydrolase [Methylocystis sp.]
MFVRAFHRRFLAVTAGARPILAVALAFVLGACVSDGLDAVQGHMGNFSSLVFAPDGESLRISEFVASTRRDDGGPESDGRTHFSLVSVSVPPGHGAGAIEQASFGSNDPRRHFTLAARRNMDEAEFLGGVAAHVSGRVGVSRDILLYVHGFNTSFDEARFRVAQIVADGRFSGVPALFAWKTRGGLIAYESDKESATVARDALEKLILDLARTPGVGRVHILAHSMGAWLTMESLRAIAISGHPDLDGRLGEVMLAAPDIDLTVFRQQVARLDPKHVSIFVASNDRALSLSSRIAGDRQRLGAMDPDNPRDKAQLDRLGVAVHDISALATGFVGHGAFAETPSVVRQIGAQLAVPRPGDPGHAIIDLLGADKEPTGALPPPAAPPAAAPSPRPSGAIESQPLAPLTR